jgi:hypothetical protein
VILEMRLHRPHRCDETQDRKATATLKDNLAHHPGGRDTLLALIGFLRDDGNLESALEYAEQLARMTPNDRTTDSLISALQEQIRKSTAQ